MKIFNLTLNSPSYTSCVYLVLGDWNTMDDVNTLIDVGRDAALIKNIRNCNTGVGKKPIEQVILTHSHYDHISILPDIQKEFNPIVCAYSDFQKADKHFKGGEPIRIADRMCEIMYTPGHSNDSICIYCEQDGILFSGDTSINIRTEDGTYEYNYISAIENLASKRIKTIYPGHGLPITENCNEIIRNSLANIKKSMRI
jgi:glyoxylase-like metal-dependent hydrolase (beta-lactamase superfamily II)